MSDEEIVLSGLSDEELVKQMHDDLYDGLGRGDRGGHADPAWIAIGPPTRC